MLGFSNLTGCLLDFMDGIREVVMGLAKRGNN